MEGEFAYNNVLPILTQKLYLLGTLDKRVCRIIAKFLISNRF